MIIICYKSWVNIYKKILATEFIEISELVPETWVREEEEVTKNVLPLPWWWATQDWQVVTQDWQSEPDMNVLLDHSLSLKCLKFLSVDLGSYPNPINQWCCIIDDINSELCTLQYVKIKDMVHQLLKLGPGAELEKLDIKSTYKIAPVHPQDRYLLGMQWNGQVYVDAALPFSLRSAQKILNSIADKVQCIAERHRVQHPRHYLDDYISVEKQTWIIVWCIYRDFLRRVGFLEYQ